MNTKKGTLKNRMTQQLLRKNNVPQSKTMKQNILKQQGHVTWHLNTYLFCQLLGTNRLSDNDVNKKSKSLFDEI